MNDLDNGILPKPKEEETKTFRIYKRSLVANVVTYDNQTLVIKTQILIRADSLTNAENKIREQFEGYLNRSFQSGLVKVVKLQFN